MKHLFKHILYSCMLITFFSCNNGENETVLSAYIEPVLPEPVYKFSRNGESSVNLLLECDFLKAPIDRLYTEYLKDALIGRKSDYDAAIRLYNEGLFGPKPKDEICTSPTHISRRTKILDDFDTWIKASARISGLGAEYPFEHKDREAVKGMSGYVGYNIGDKDICFVDEKGFAVAEVYKYAIMGAIYLDKILNLHLNKNILEDKELRNKHDLTQLLPGHNYTEFEHHWDLAYGYFGFLKELSKSDGIPALKGAFTRISRVFAEGRAYMETSRYDEIGLKADTIRQELSCVVAVRAISLLIGVNTIANINEKPARAFRFQSQAYGLIYALQFSCDAQGTPLFTESEIESLLNELEKEGGLWDKDRLAGDEQNEGSLLKTAKRIGAKVGVDVNDIKK